MGLKEFSVVLLFLIGGALSHSWLTCTDYLQENGDYWSSSNCRAYARHGHKFTPKNNFGIDTGYDYNNVQENQPCKTARSDSTAYTSEYPMAVYYTGQKVVISHPTKNHVAESCTNKYIPDHGNFVYRSGVNPRKDPSLTEFKQNLVADFGVALFGYTKTQADITTYPKPGFQNAPKFCENTDKALATNAFYIPNLQPGRYTFMWSWSFNSKGPGDTYTTCWEADVVGSRGERDQVLNSRSLPTNDPQLLHGKSLAKAPAGVAVPPVAAPTVARPVQTPGRTKKPAQTKRPVTSRPQFVTSRPGNSGVSSNLVCLDQCLSKCYGSP